MAKIKRILFICYANTCRSPAAQHLADFYAKKYDLQGVFFDSAGWHNAFNYAQPETIDYIQSKGIEINDFQPKVITRELVEKQDLIIGMERYHLTKVKNRFRDLQEQLKQKLFTLKEFNGVDKKDINIPDPYKTEKKRYDEILEIVEKNVKALVKKVKRVNQ